MVDALDHQIIGILTKNSRMPASEIGKLISLSIPAVTERIRKLERTGVIQGYTVCLDYNQLGYKLLAYLLVTVDGPRYASIFKETVNAQPQIIECHHITGEYDYLLKVLVEDTSALESFISQVLKNDHGVIRSNTLVVLSTLKQ